jgi:hypothetical protein
MLWGVLFLYLQLEEYSHGQVWYELFGGISPLALPTQLLVLPLLLFLVCLLALFVQQEKQRRRKAGLRRVGFTVAGLGLATTAMFTANEYWLARLLQQPAEGFIHYSYAGLLFDWDRATSSAFALTIIGLCLFGMAAARARAFPNRLLVLFVTVPLSIFAVQVGLGLFVGGYDFYLVLYGGVFVALMLLFGVFWAAAGYHLLRSQPAVEGRARKPAQAGDI